MACRICDGHGHNSRHHTEDERRAHARKLAEQALQPREPTTPTVRTVPRPKPRYDPHDVHDEPPMVGVSSYQRLNRDNRGHPPYVSDQTIAIDTMAKAHGWRKRKSILGDEVTYFRNATTLKLEITVTGAVVNGSTSRDGGLKMPIGNTGISRDTWVEAVLTTRPGARILVS